MVNVAVWFALTDTFAGCRAICNVDDLIGDLAKKTGATPEESSYGGIKSCK